MKQLLVSRRLWAFLIGQILTIGTFVFAHYNQDPFATQLSGMVVSFIEGLTGVALIAFTVDDSRLNTAQVKSNTEIQVAAINAGSHPDFPLPLALDQSGETYGSAGVRALDDAALRATITDKAQTDARLTALEHPDEIITQERKP